MTLSQIVGRMQELKRRTDRAVSVDANDLLVETIRELSQLANKKEQADADLILIAYEQIPKWYA